MVSEVAGFQSGHGKAHMIMATVQKCPHRANTKLVRTKNISLDLDLFPLRVLSHHMRFFCPHFRGWWELVHKGHFIGDQVNEGGDWLTRGTGGACAMVGLLPPIFSPGSPSFPLILF